jgi:hypothetical protein
VAFDKLVNRVLGNSLRVFGEVVTFLPASGGGYHIRGIFRSSYKGIDAQTGLEVSTNRPVLDVRLADFLTKPTTNDKVVVGILSHRIYDIQEDGDGGASLILHKLEPYRFTADSTALTADTTTITADAT